MDDSGWHLPDNKNRVSAVAHHSVSYPVTPLALKAQETARLSSALLCLLSPSESPWADTWPARAARGLRALAGGDKAVVVVETNGTTDMYGDGVPRDAIDAYTTHYGRLDLGMARQRAAGLEVWSRSMLWEKTVLARSEYYNDFARPHGLHDTVGLAAVQPLLAVRVCVALFHHDPVRCPGVTTRQLRLLALVLPAFTTGVRLWALAWRSGNPHFSATGHAPLRSVGLGGTVAPPSSSAFQARYGLTDREAQVAGLLVWRRTNAEIASTLGISLHTARHHTESVLLKIGVHSRAAVERAISCV
jgi:Response regulator containing a CheY-like receiver domain and an HTH DNA-binding domain